MAKGILDRVATEGWRVVLSSVMVRSSVVTIVLTYGRVLRCGLRGSIFIIALFWLYCLWRVGDFGTKGRKAYQFCGIIVALPGSRWILGLGAGRRGPGKIRHPDVADSDWPIGRMRPGAYGHDSITPPLHYEAGQQWVYPRGLQSQRHLGQWDADSHLPPARWRSGSHR